MKLHSIVAISLAVFAGQAAADSFDFTGMGSINDSVSSVNVASATGDVTVTVSTASGNIGAYNLDGFGVKDGFLNLPGLQNGETLNFAFSETVDIGTIHMRQWEGPDRVILVSYGDGSSVVLDDDSAAFNTNEYFAVNLTGIDSLTITGQASVSLVAGFQNVTLSAVPVPAAAWLFGSALVGLGGMARRKR